MADLFFDGCCKGNNKSSDSTKRICGAGAILFFNDEVKTISKKLDNKYNTNNQAEYLGLIYGLELAIQHNIKNLNVYGDSLLVINQVNNKFKCNNKDLILLLNRVKILIKQFEKINFEHILREKNKLADKLCNDSLK